MWLFQLSVQDSRGQGFVGWGIGILKGLFERLAQYQRPRCGFNPRTSLSDMRAFIVRGEFDRLIFPGSGFLGTVNAIKADLVLFVDFVQNSDGIAVGNVNNFGLKVGSVTQAG